MKIKEDWRQLAFYNTQIEKDLDKAKAIFETLPREPKFDEMIKGKDNLIRQKDKANLEKYKGITVRTEWATTHPYTNMLSLVGLLPTTIALSLGESDEDGGLGLDKAKKYYIYDFWNDCFVGKFKGTDTLSQDLRMGEARMMSVHAVKDYPQFISTNRHILQGYVDMIVLPAWDSVEKTLTGSLAVIEKDPYKIIIALNGYKASKIQAKGVSADFKIIDEANDLAEITLKAEKNTEAKWTLFFL